MGLTLIEQRQMEMSSAYDDAKDLTTRTNAESTPAIIQDDLDYLRTLVNEIKGKTNWYDAPDEDMATLYARTKLEDKYMMSRTQLLTDITVPSSQNYVVLSQASSETPTVGAAVTSTQEGAIVAVLSGDVGSHGLDEVAGSSAISPKNLVHVVDGSTGDQILSSGRVIYGLLQAESGVTDGDSFNDTDKQVQISFVRRNSTNDDLEAVPAADIQTKVINYKYANRKTLSNASEQDYDKSSSFVDQAAAVDVTLDNAIDNQSGAATQDQNIDVRITDTYSWQFSDSAGVNILNVSAASGGDSVDIGSGSNTVGLTVYGDIDNTGSIQADSDGTPINIGATAGRIDATSLEVQATTGNLTLNGNGGELYFDDSRLGSAIPLTDATYNTLPESASSIYEAINLAYNNGGSVVTRKDVNTILAVTANTLLTADGGTPNLSDDLLNYWDTDSSTTATNFVNNVIIFINGVYVRPGLNSGSNDDVYPSTVQAECEAGNFYSESTIKNGANIMMALITT